MPFFAKGLVKEQQEARKIPEEELPVVRERAEQFRERCENLGILTTFGSVVACLISPLSGVVCVFAGGGATMLLNARNSFRVKLLEQEVVSRGLPLNDV